MLAWQKIEASAFVKYLVKKDVKCGFVQTRSTYVGAF